MNDLSIYESKEWLDRKECAAYLTALGRPISTHRLSNMASNNNAGKGPPLYRISWTRVRYKSIEVKNWAISQMRRIP